MRIGVPKEIKVHEYRVGLTPASVAELVAHGHEVFVETKAGSGIDCPDKAFEKCERHKDNDHPHQNVEDDFARHRNLHYTCAGTTDQSSSNALL